MGMGIDMEVSHSSRGFGGVAMKCMTLRNCLTPVPSAKLSPIIISAQADHVEACCNPPCVGLLVNACCWSGCDRTR